MLRVCWLCRCECAVAWQMWRKQQVVQARRCCECAGCADVNVLWLGNFGESSKLCKHVGAASVLVVQM